jgi:hypothetical protein
MAPLYRCRKFDYIPFFVGLLCDKLPSSQKKDFSKNSETLICLGAEKWNRTTDTGIFRPIQVYFYNKGKALSIGVSPFFIKDLSRFVSFDRI